MESKKPYHSKTLIVNAVVAVLALFAPGASEFISSHPGEVTIVFSLINMAIRLVTKDKISIGE